MPQKGAHISPKKRVVAAKKGGLPQTGGKHMRETREPQNRVVFKTAREPPMGMINPLPSGKNGRENPVAPKGEPTPTVLGKRER